MREAGGRENRDINSVNGISVYDTSFDTLHINECTRKRKSTGGREVCVCVCVRIDWGVSRRDMNQMLRLVVS